MNWVFVYKLSDGEFESCFSQWNFKFRACFKQRVLDIQVTTECRFTLKIHACDMTKKTYNNFKSALIISLWRLLFLLLLLLSWSRFNTAITLIVAIITIVVLYTTGCSCRSWELSWSPQVIKFSFITSYFCIIIFYFVFCFVKELILTVARSIFDNSILLTCFYRHKFGCDRYRHLLINSIYINWLGKFKTIKTI